MLPDVQFGWPPIIPTPTPFVPAAPIPPCTATASSVTPALALPKTPYDEPLGAIGSAFTETRRSVSVDPDSAMTTVCPVKTWWFPWMRATLKSQIGSQTPPSINQPPSTTTEPDPSTRFPLAFAV